MRELEYTTFTLVFQRTFIYLISILAKFVLFEYNHLVIVIESQYRESDFLRFGLRERLSLTILMSQYDIIMFIIHSKYFPVSDWLKPQA